MSEPQKRYVFPAVLACLCLLVLSVTYLAAAKVRSGRLQQDLASSQGGSTANVYKWDPALGHVNAPGISALDRIPLGETVALRHDARGFRIAEKAVPPASGRRQRVLFLGDSFTYGRMVPAEKTFASLAASHLGAEGLNAGVNGYGLAQMVLQARRLIPKYRPDVVVVQYSPWLVDRAMDPFVPADTGKLERPVHIPAPYYADGEPLQIAPPAFDTGPEQSLLPTARSLAAASGEWSFFWHYGLPVIWHQDTRLGMFSLRQMLRIAPRPTQDRAAVVRSAYADIAGLAARHHARMLILALGDDTPLQVPGDLFPAGIGGVNGWRLLAAQQPAMTAADYSRQYMIWRGEPPQLVDWHLNERGHALIAEALVTRIRMMH